MFGHTRWSENGDDEWASVGEALKAVGVVGSMGGVADSQFAYFFLTRR